MPAAASNPLGFGRIQLPSVGEQGTEQVMVQRPLARVMAFTGLSIDQVVNDPVAKNLVWGYYKLYKQVQRACEVAELERWWNRTGG